jgi:hypothetical protein
MFEESISLGRHENISRLERGSLRSPPKSCDGHVVALPLLINLAAESERALSSLGIINTDGAISETTGKIPISWVKSTGENF